MVSTIDEETMVVDLGVDVPIWIDQELSLYNIDSINQSGCASGAYLPAVTYYMASQTMADHGDDVLDYIQDAYGELPRPRDDESWSGMAVHYLSLAVELFTSSIEEELANYPRD